MKADKIKKLYSEKFGCQMPTDAEIQLLIKHHCRCDNCNTSIFKLGDFPEIIEETGEVFCEHCYNELAHRIYCAICSDSYDTYQKITEWFWYENRKDATNGKRLPGIYKIPWFNIDREPTVKNYELLVNADIETDYSSWVCPDCAQKYSKKDNYLTVEDAPCILFEKYRAYYKEYSDEQLHEARQQVIHERITNRGIIEQANRELK